MDYGWAKYREEGVKELKRLAASRLFMNKPAKRAILNRYVEIYEKGEEGNLTGRHIVDQRVGEDDNALSKRASNHIIELRKQFRRFYDSEEGRNSTFEIYFIAESRDYRLGVRPRNDQKTIPEEIGRCLSPDEIVFKENLLFKTKYRPIPIIILMSVLSLTAFLGIITGVIFVNSLLLFAFLLAFSFSLLYLSWNLYRLLFWEFSHFLHKYFIRHKGEELFLASYSSTCPECGRTMQLTSKKDIGKNYIAMCSKAENDHRFSFKYNSLIGKRICKKE